MTTKHWLMIIVIIAAIAALGGYWIGAHGEGDAGHEHNEEAATKPSEDEKPVVPVVTAPLTVSRIAETVRAYGTVVAEAGDVHAVSVPFESRVARVLVTPGQHVSKGAALVKAEASPDTLVALQEAKNAVAATAADLKQAEQRFAEHLATNVDLSQARQAAQSAALKLASLLERHVGESLELNADFDGVVHKVDVQEGLIVPAGAPLVELAAGNRFEVRLNVDPADASILKPDAEVQLQPVGGRGADKPSVGKIRMVGERVDPSTRMVEVRVALPPDAKLMLESFVTATLNGPSVEGFVVPREAALPNDDGSYTLFTVRDHHAAAHAVKRGVEGNQLVQVIGEDLKAGDLVVVRGNYLLEDGSEVEVTAAPATRKTDAKAEAAP